MANTPHNIEIRKDEDNSRYVMQVNRELVGYAEYVDKDQVRNFNHTVITPEHRGQGYATELIQFALDDTREEGLKVVPTCSAVLGFIAKNEPYRDLVAGDDER